MKQRLVSRLSALERRTETTERTITGFKVIIQYPDEGLAEHYMMPICGEEWERGQRIYQDHPRLRTSNLIRQDVWEEYE